MTRNADFTWRLFVAFISLLAAVAVYRYARIHPPEIFKPFQAFNADLAPHTIIFNSAPSFLYTLALGLIFSVCASSRSQARFHCLAWLCLCACLELTQLSNIALAISELLPEVLPKTAWHFIGPYWLQGTFDPNDLIATIAGGLIAMASIPGFSAGTSSATN